jgi:POTRA domain, FtsQ-type
MWGKKKSAFREEMYLPKRQVKRPKRGEVVEDKKRTFPWLALLLWICFLGTSAYMLLFSPVMNIEVLHTEGNVLVSQSDVEKYFAEERESVTWHVFKRSNYFLFQTERLKQNLQNTFPAIEDISVEKKFPNKINIYIKERAIAILWCSRGPCALVRSDGRAVEGALVPEKKGLLPLYTIVDTGGLPIVLGERLFDYPFVENFDTNRKLLSEELNITFKNEATSASRFSDEVRLNTDAGYELLLNARLEPRQNIKFLRLFFDQELPYDRQGELRSIDLRTENRIYYTLKNAPEKEEEASTTEDATKDTTLPKKEEKQNNKKTTKKE